MAGFAEWKEKILFWLLAAVVSACATGFSGWSAWITLQVVNKPNTDEVKAIVVSEAPYNKDEKLIRATLERMDTVDNRQIAAIEDLAQAFNDLRVEIANQQREIR